MQKIKINERQVLMLQKLQGGASNTKVLKINEDQYNRLFKEGFNANKNLDKSFKKEGVGEESKKGDLLTFAQEVIVFIKDMLSRPESAPFSKFWLKKGVSKDKLISMLEKEGLLTMNLGEADGVKSYVTEKYGFRGKIKEFYNTINEFGGDGGYPAGADNDPNAPWNQEDPEPRPEDDTSNDDDNVVLPTDTPLTLKFYSGSDNDNLMVFSDRSGRLVLVNGERMLAHSNHDEFEVYQTIKGDDRNLKAPIFYYVNDKYQSGEMKVYNTFDAYTKGQLVIVTPEIKNELLRNFKGNNELASMLNQIPETTGAGSSGAFVGGMSNGPINRGKSPEDAMGELISDGVDATGIAQYHSDRKGEEPFIIDNIKWQYCNVNHNGKIDIGVYRYGQDLCYSYEWFNKNVLKNDLEETTSMGGSSGINVGNGGDSIEHDVNAFGSSSFMKAGNKLNKGKGDMPMINRSIGENSIKNALKKGLGKLKFPEEAFSKAEEEFNKSEEEAKAKKASKIKEGDEQIFSQTDEYRSGFELNEKDQAMFNYQHVRQQWENEGPEGKQFLKPRLEAAFAKTGLASGKEMFSEGIQVGQVYKNGIGRRKIDVVNHFSGVIKARQWGDGAARDVSLSKKEFGGWELLSESKKILKITEDQLKKIIESNNLTSTAYPNGEMVDFDDCTKLNNNKVAQNGGCSQGDDGVVKLSKTKDAVVAEVARITGKPINEVRLIIEGNESQELIPLFISAINQVDESLGYEELANAIGYIINEHYGSHLVEPFLNKLNQILVRRTEGEY